MKKKKFILSMFVLLVGVVVIYHNYDKNNILDDTESKVIKKENTLSMMLETEAGSGKYEMTTRSDWPTDGYVFNSSLSRCENGGELAWDDTNKKVIMSGNMSDKCYVYFDKSPILLADYVKSLYTGTQGENGIYYHDASLTNGAGDNSYRYAGANPNNYVCFGSSASPCPTDNLCRIIGVFGNQVKLIKYDYATSALLGTDGDYQGTGTPNASYYKGSLTTINTYYWNNSTKKNTWSESLLNKTNLNTNFINNIGTEWANKIATTTWKVGGNTYANIRDVIPSVAYQNEIVNPVTTNTTDNATEYSAKIGLMYVSDYGFGADPSAWTTTLYNYDGSVNGSTIRSLNWMHMGYFEWTISRSADISDIAFRVDNDGNVYNDYVDRYIAVRPSFNLESSITYVSGSGSASDPMVIN